LFYSSAAVAHAAAAALRDVAVKEVPAQISLMSFQHFAS